VGKSSTKLNHAKLADDRDRLDGEKDRIGEYASEYVELVRELSAVDLIEKLTHYEGVEDDRVL